jgi:hypothetical protein
LDKKLEQYYVDRFDMFQSQGWKDLMEDARGVRDSISDIKKINSAEALWHRKGELETLEWLLGLEAVSEAVYQQLTEEQ